MTLHKLAAVLAVILVLQMGLAAPNARADNGTTNFTPLLAASLGCVFLLGIFDSIANLENKAPRINDGSVPATGSDFESSHLDERVLAIQRIDRYLILSTVGANHARGEAPFHLLTNGFINVVNAFPGYEAYLGWRSDDHSPVSREYFEAAIEGISEIGARVEEVEVQGLEPVEGKEGQFSRVTEYRFEADAGVLTVTVEGNAVYGPRGGTLIWNPPRIVKFENNGLEN